MREGRFGARERSTVEKLVGDTAFLEDLDVTCDGIHLSLRTKELKRATGSPFIVDAGIGAQLLQARSAVLGNAHHAFLVDRVARGIAFAQHRSHPAQLEHGAIRPDG